MTVLVVITSILFHSIGFALSEICGSPKVFVGPRFDKRCSWWENSIRHGSSYRRSEHARERGGTRDRLRFESVQDTIDRQNHWFSLRNRLDPIVVVGVLRVQTRYSSGCSLISRKWKAREWLMMRLSARRAGSCGNTLLLFPVFPRRRDNLFSFRYPSTISCLIFVFFDFISCNLLIFWARFLNEEE